jgi:hypothetical protein
VDELAQAIGRDTMAVYVGYCNTSRSDSRARGAGTRRHAGAPRGGAVRTLVGMAGSPGLLDLVMGYSGRGGAPRFVMAAQLILTAVGSLEVSHADARDARDPEQQHQQLYRSAHPSHLSIPFAAVHIRTIGWSGLIAKRRQGAAAPEKST